MRKLPCKVIWLGAVVLGLVFASGGAAVAQNAAEGAAQASNADAANLNVDLQIQVLLASNGGSDTGSLPNNLAGVVREIRNNLQFSQVRLGATFQNRVEVSNGLQVNGIVTSSVLTQPGISQNPLFYSYSIGKLRAGSNADQLQLDPFRFALRVPVQTGSSAVMNYENLGVTTNATIRIGEPTIIGTLNIGHPDESLVLVVTARRIGR